ncbi:MAG: preprotein translocase subunit SecE [Actinomycetota bacterium]
MNRQMKRAQERQERQSKRSGLDRQATPAATTRRTAAQEKRKRTPIREFLRQVRQELSKVDWPSRRQLASYTVVVLVTVAVMTAFVFVLDLGFSKAIVNILT